jgi:beta-glucanase (GH16 family)
MRFLLYTTLAFIIFSCASTQKNITTVPVAPKGWKLVWNDEFNGHGLPDSSKWGFDVGAKKWGNNELEYYTDHDTSNVKQQDGHLIITARKQEKEGMDYTSARLKTKSKAEFQYGRIEASAKLPATVGTWPAIWMLGADIDRVDWPACGEIDIMEHRGMELNKIFGTLHYPGHFGANGNGKTIMIHDATTAFHQYAVEWSPSEIKFFVDNLVYHTVANPDSIPFNHPFFILLNLAMGGDFGGKVDPGFTADSMLVDYVRVYERVE